jgi:hypothetical protein
MQEARRLAYRQALYTFREQQARKEAQAYKNVPSTSEKERQHSKEMIMLRQEKMAVEEKLRLKCIEYEKLHKSNIILTRKLHHCSEKLGKEKNISNIPNEEMAGVELSS